MMQRPFASIPLPRGKTTRAVPMESALPRCGGRSDGLADFFAVFWMRTKVLTCEARVLIS